MSEQTNNPMGSPLSILVVDDDELNQRMMRLILKREGHSIEIASNGFDAVQAVKSKTYDLVLMDLQMPTMDGIEASRQIREWENGKSHIFIVALTASYLPEKGRELFEAGIDNYLAKPFEVEHLRHILRYGLENKFKRSFNAEKTQPEPTGNIQEINFETGIQRVGGDANIYKEFLNDFVTELPGKLENLRLHFRNKDMDALGRAAHNLKGVSANLGALQLSEHAQRLEKQVSQGYTASIEVLLIDISSTIEKLKETANNYLAGRIVKAAEVE